MSNLESLLKFAPDLRLCARADHMGNVVERAGTGDGESVCAIVAVSGQAIDRAAEALGLGQRRGYSFVGKKLALYVHERPDGFVVAVGEPKNVESTMKKIDEKL